MTEQEELEFLKKYRKLLSDMKRCATNVPEDLQGALLAVHQAATLLYMKHRRSREDGDE